MYENILYSKKDGIATIAVNRPQVRNALNIATLDELRHAFAEAGAAEDVLVVVLTATGDKAFVAGADISEIAAEYALRGQSVFDSIETLPKPVIAAVNGYALGGGCELAMACTIRVASENAMFGQPEVKLGLIPGFGGSQRLPRLVGKGRALQMLLTGEMVSAVEALKMGLVNQVVSGEELIGAAEALAKKIMGNGPLAVRFCMEAVNRGMNMSLEEGQLLEAKLFAQCCATADMKEGTAAFLEKRTPKFTGK